VKRSTTIPLGQYTVSIRITTFVRDLEIAWTIEHPLIDPPMGYVYGYVLEPVESGTLVTSLLRLVKRPRSAPNSD